MFKIQTDLDFLEYFRYDFVILSRHLRNNSVIVVKNQMDNSKSNSLSRQLTFSDMNIVFRKAKVVPQSKVATFKH